MEISATYNYTVSKHFITGLYYYDISGYTDNDIKRLDAFLESEVRQGTIEVIDESETFDRCDITGLMSDCIEIEVNHFNRG